MQCTPLFAWIMGEVLDSGAPAGMARTSETELSQPHVYVFRINKNWCLKRET